MAEQPYKDENDAPEATTSSIAPQPPIPSGPPELDEWGLPIRHLPPPIRTPSIPSKSDKEPLHSETLSPPLEKPTLGTKHNGSSKLSITSVQSEVERIESLRRESAERARLARRGSHAPSTDEDEDFRDVVEEEAPDPAAQRSEIAVEKKGVEDAIEKIKEHKVEEAGEIIAKAEIKVVPVEERSTLMLTAGTMKEQEEVQQGKKKDGAPARGLMDKADDLSEQLAAAAAAERGHTKDKSMDPTSPNGARSHHRQVSTASQLDGAAHKAIFSAPPGAKVSEWSHQAPLVPETPKKVEEEEDEWQEMPAYAPYDIYDDDNKLVAKEAVESDDEEIGRASCRERVF